MPTLLRDGTIIRDVSKTDESIYCSPAAATTEAVFPPGCCDPAPILAVASEDDVVKTTLTFSFEETEADAVLRLGHTTAKDEDEVEGRDAGFTILCAEDNRVNQRLLAKCLSRFDIDTVMVENGEKALERYKADPERFRCILMDISMPVMGGIESTRLIRSFESTRADLRAAFVVGLTAHAAAGQSAAVGLARHGFDALLCKPISMAKMVDVLFGDDASNIVTAYAGLTERERRRFPLRPQERRGPGGGGGGGGGGGVIGMYGTCARGRAVAEELVRMRQRGEFDNLRFMIDVRIKVVKTKKEEEGDGGGSGGCQEGGIRIPGSGEEQGAVLV
ncbi:CheY-like superfamily [Biscogniauxia sp. FL1348]|nr:CheY-like superfamily [Biscogniauxia sp. FL1348]